MRERIRGRRGLAQLNPVPTLPAAWLIFAAMVSCEAGEQDCLAYACTSKAYLNGSVEIPDDTSAVDVRFCSTWGCLEGLLDVREVRETECASGPVADFHGSVCATRTASGRLELEASLSGEDTGSVPPDGESYTLEVVDHDSGRVLVDEETKANYDTSSNQDSCHRCWLTKMTF